VRGEIAMCPLLYNAIYPNRRKTAPGQRIFTPEGAPVNPYDTEFEDRGNPQCRAKVSSTGAVERGQDLHVQGAWPPHVVERATVYPEGFDPKVSQGLAAQVLTT